MICEAATVLIPQLTPGACHRGSYIGCCPLYTWSAPWAEWWSSLVSPREPGSLEKKWTAMKPRLWNKGYILLGLFWLFLFRFRNNRIHGISTPKRTLIHSENGILMAEVTWELLRLPTGSQATGAGGRVGFPAKNFPKEHVFCVFRVNRIPFIPFIPFILLSGAEWTEWYSVHSENGIAPKRTRIPSIPSIPIPE